MNAPCLTIGLLSSFDVLILLKVLFLQRSTVFFESLKGFRGMRVVPDFMNIIIEIIGNVDSDDLVSLFVDVDLYKSTLTKVI